MHQVPTAVACGAKSIFLTNSAWENKDSFCPGQQVLVSDHMNLNGAFPPASDKFIELTDLYSHRSSYISKAVYGGVHEGVYVQFQEPQCETPAEVRMARAMREDAVRTSTGLEAIAARKWIGNVSLSRPLNIAPGTCATPLSHREVMEAVERAGAVISALQSMIAQLVSRLLICLRLSSKPVWFGVRSLDIATMRACCLREQRRLNP